MDKNVSNKSGCPVAGVFCWKNPVHLALAFAVLPFTINGIQTVATWLSNFMGNIAS
jgi:hypothetical protein